MHKWFEDFIHQARKNALRCLQRLIEIVDDDDVEPRHRIAACKTILAIATSKDALAVRGEEFETMSPLEQERILVNALQEVRDRITNIN